MDIGNFLRTFLASQVDHLPTFITPCMSSIHGITWWLSCRAKEGKMWNNTDVCMLYLNKLHSLSFFYYGWRTSTWYKNMEFIRACTGKMLGKYYHVVVGSYLTHFFQFSLCLIKACFVSIFKYKTISFVVYDLNFSILSAF